MRGNVRNRAPGPNVAEHLLVRVCEKYGFGVRWGGRQPCGDARVVLQNERVCLSSVAGRGPHSRERKREPPSVGGPNCGRRGCQACSYSIRSVARFCSEFVLSLCEQSATEVVVINPTTENSRRFSFGRDASDGAAQINGERSERGASEG